jgi:hypothetical protein
LAGHQRAKQADGQSPKAWHFISVCSSNIVGGIKAFSKNKKK